MKLTLRSYPHAIVLSLLASALAAARAPAQTTTTYIGNETIEEPYTILNSVPIRPMVLAPAQNRMWAVNVHGSQVHEYTNATGNPTRSWDVPWNPISIAFYESTDADSPGEKLLVVCRGSYVLVRIDVLSGTIERVVALPPQPQDLLVDPAASPQRAFVSCAATDEVVELDLSGAISIVRTFKIPGKTPTHMFFDASNDVVVAPLHSGNNSAIHKTLHPNPLQTPSVQAGTMGILDLDDPNIALVNPQGVRGLPDQDLFRLVRSTGAVVPIARSLGTLLFGNALNPVTGAYWQVGIEANNKDPNKQTEPAIKGFIAQNRLAIFDPATQAKTIIDLDDSDPNTTGVQYNTALTVGHPGGVEMTSFGFGFVWGVQTDNVTLLDTAGASVVEWDVPAGSIPRRVMYSPVLNTAFVYCWGTNEIRAYTVSLTPSVWATFLLGQDPTPDDVKIGRQLFYDASHSLNNNASCETCHVEITTDMLAWNLSAGIKDDKGPLVTQTIRGLEGTVPFHWRGEQQVGLSDFNPAFANLLGGTQLNATELAQFSAFVLRTRNDANPRQNRERLVDSTIQPPMKPGAPTANAVTGKNLFIVTGSLVDNNCILCHMPPLGTNNEIQALAPAAFDPNPRRQRFEVAYFNELWKKEQDADPLTAGTQLVTVLFNTTVNPQLPVQMDYPLLGFGLGHAGTVANVHQFIEIFDDQQLPGGGFGPQQTADVTAFTDQADQRMGRAAHQAYLLDVNTVATIATELSGYLEPQATNRNCDIAVFGTSTIGGTPTFMRWAFDRSSGLYVAERTTVTSQPLSFFTGQASANTGSNVFVGLPVGTSEQFALDWDLDDLRNGDEVAVWGSNPRIADTDGDTWLDGHEVNNPPGNPTNAALVPNDQTPPTVTDNRTQTATTRNAVLALACNEPVKVHVAYSATGLTPRVFDDSHFTKLHRVVLDGLAASTSPSVLHTYTATITFTDLGGKTTTASFANPPFPYNAFGPTLTSGPFAASGANELVAGNLAFTSIGRLAGGTAVSVRATMRLDFKTGGPGVAAQNRIPIFRVLRNGTPVAFTTPMGTPTTWSFGSPATPYASLPGASTGPFLIGGTPTNASGVTNIQFALGGIVTGDVITLNLEFAGQVQGTWTPATPVITNFNEYDFSDTPAGFRAISFVN